MIEPPEIRTTGPITVVGMHRPMTFASPAIPSLWRAFRPRVGEIEGRTSDDFISMRIYEGPVGPAPTPDARFEQWAAVEVDGTAPPPDGMDSHVIGPGTYAVFPYTGRADAFADAARFIYGHWLPRSGYRLADREFFEVLGPDYRPDDPDATERIWIPVAR